MTLPPTTHNQPAALGARSKAEFERAKDITPGGSMRLATYFAPHPPFAARGSGAWIIDVDGRHILDCANNFFSLIHGHAFPPVLEALRGVIDQGTAFGIPTSHEIELANAIRDRSPRLEQVRFVNSGTEAVMFAVKGARGITGRHAIAKFEGAYHGAYDPVEVSALQVFTEPFVIFGGGPSQNPGGPLNSVLMYSVRLFTVAFQQFQMGYAAAMAWILFVIIFTLSLLAMQLSRRFVHYD